MTVRYLEPEPLNGTDAALWDIERNPALRTTIVSVLTLDRSVDHDRLIAVLDAASRSIPRLRQHVEGAPLGMGVPKWVVTDDFDIHDHVSMVTADADGARAEFDSVLDVATSFATTPFERSRPLWECAYVDLPDEELPAVVLKVHHSLADGIGGVALLDALLDARRTTRPRDPTTLPEYRRAPSADGPHPPRLPLDTLASAPLMTGRFVLDAALNPLRTVKTVAGAGASAARMLAPSGEMLSPLFTRRGSGRHLGIHEVDLDRLHDAAARHGSTINDLFVAAVVEGAAEYHRERSAPLVALRVTMPMNIRSRTSPAAGNQWVPIRFRAPADIDDPIDRMAAVRTLTTKPRTEPVLKFSHSLAGAIQILPSALSSAVVSEMMSGVDLVVTNVPGLSETRYLAGARVERMYAFAPTGGAAFNVSLMSHGSTACFGMMSDTDAVGDPEDLHTAIAQAIDATIDAAESTAPRPDHGSRSSTPPRSGTAPPENRSPERLSALDVGFLQLETAETPMHLGGVFVLDGDPLRDDDGALRIDAIRRHVEARLPRVPAYLRRLGDVPLRLHRPVWIDDAEFDIAEHVQVASLEEHVIHDGTGGDFAHALVLCADINAERLDRSRPLWEIWLLDGLDDDSVVMLLKIHHALTDGVGSVELIAALFDLEAEPAEESPGVARAGTPAPSALRTITDATIDHLRDPVQVARDTAASAARTPAVLARRVGTIAAGLSDLIGPTAVAPPSVLNAPVGTFRTILPIELDFAGIDEIRAEHGGSANDVALTVIAGGLRAWFEARGDDLPDLHVLCPVSERGATTGEVKAGSGGNHVGAMLIGLPLGEPDPVRRLAIIRERTGRAKSRHDGDGVAWALDAFDHLPTIPGPALRQLLAHQPFANLVVTNVPGPPRPLWFFGAPVASAVPVVPLGPNTALGIALFSYHGRLTIGLHADPERCPDLHVLAEAAVAEFEAMR